ncbi:hypothetical protein Aph01nite_15520 [Acrocarpospora phusangensis]|uniref:Peptidase M52 n=1 Tax=Acrocarpospora phusangensis TaxID=1070424 RepID=A0A919Q6K3_9ACTN|nr:hydrogenase maturation protease [Acrocarpospora phusangensis]GIH23242.1 hypothetical protein Aph01nite_15520 [Acrocarpospora phusangensis]
MTDIQRVLVAGIGNIFLGDDGFGVEVVNRINASALPPSVDVTDYGIRGVHLAYELLNGRYNSLIMVDAVPIEGPPGSLIVLEVDPTEDDPDTLGPVPVNGHGMHPQAVLNLLRDLGGGVERVLIVGCKPAVIDEGMGLSAPVAAALDDAVRLVADLARHEAETLATSAIRQNARQEIQRGVQEGSRLESQQGTRQEAQREARRRSPRGIEQEARQATRQETQQDTKQASVRRPVDVESADA